MRGEPQHAFQACALSHSATCPEAIYVLLAWVEADTNQKHAPFQVFAVKIVILDFASLNRFCYATASITYMGPLYMTSGIRNFIFILILPFLAAVGHDVYFNYFADSEKARQIKNLQVNPEEFLVSDLGWIWQNYSPNTMQTARNMVEPDIWATQVDPILQLPSMVVGIIPFFLGCVFLLFAFILGVWPFSKFGQARREKEADFAVYKHAKSKPIKFSKK